MHDQEGGNKTGGEGGEQRGNERGGSQLLVLLKPLSARKPYVSLHTSPFSPSSPPSSSLLPLVAFAADGRGHGFVFTAGAGSGKNGALKNFVIESSEFVSADESAWSFVDLFAYRIPIGIGFVVVIFSFLFFVLFCFCFVLYFTLADTTRSLLSHTRWPADRRRLLVVEGTGEAALVREIWGWGLAWGR